MTDSEPQASNSHTEQLERRTSSSNDIVLDITDENSMNISAVSEDSKTVICTNKNTVSDISDGNTMTVGAAASCYEIMTDDTDNSKIAPNLTCGVDVSQPIVSTNNLDALIIASEEPLKSNNLKIPDTSASSTSCNTLDVCLPSEKYLESNENHIIEKHSLYKASNNLCEQLAMKSSSEYQFLYQHKVLEDPANQIKCVENTTNHKENNMLV